jgi:hypothetical protein
MPSYVSVDAILCRNEQPQERAAIDPIHITFCTKTQITLTVRRKEVEKEAH